MYLKYRITWASGYTEITAWPLNWSAADVKKQMDYDSNNVVSVELIG